MLQGNNGADKFVYLSARDTGDLILDFSRAEGDRIDLSAFDDLEFAGALSSPGAVGAGQVGFTQADGQTTVYVDTDGVAGADLEITLNSLVNLMAGDFILG